MDGAYSFSLTTFSPSGKLVQIEYALNAVNAGATALGIKGIGFYRNSFFTHCAVNNGVVIATEKKMPSTLIDDTSVQKIAVLSARIGVVYAGMGPDARVLIVY